MNFKSSLYSAWIQSIAISIMGFSIPALGATNLVVNPGFENGSAPWNTGSSKVVANNAHSGTYSLYGGRYAYAPQKITGLSPNTQYTLSGYIKSGGSYHESYLGVKKYGGVEKTTMTSSSSYTQVSLTFKTGSRSTSAIIYFYVDVGSAYFDDVSLVATDVNTTPTTTTTTTTSTTTTTMAPAPSPAPAPAPSPSPAPSTSFPAPFAPVRTVTVCASGCNYTLPSQAIANAVDYELIQIKAGTYTDCATIPAKHLWLQGYGGGFAHLQDKVCGSKGILVNDGIDVTIDNMEFSGMVLSTETNAAGIRHESGNLTVRNGYFHDGQEGMLVNNVSTINVTILNSHFARLGATGQEHDMYMGNIGSFTLRNSIIEQAKIGHEVKTRAYKSTIQCNKIMGGYDSTYQDSYNVDMPNGGEEHINNNLIAQGPYQQNPSSISFGAEGLSNPTQSMDFTGNIVINDLGKGYFVNIMNAPSGGFYSSNNQFIGAGTVFTGSTSTLHSSGDQTFSSRSAAGYTEQFPMPTACTSPVGNVSVP